MRRLINKPGLLVSMLTTGLPFVATVSAEPIITISSEDDLVPDEAFYAANPSAVTNFEGTGFLVEGGPTDPFDFGGTTVNLRDQAQVGTRFTRSWIDNVTLNMEDGRLEDGTTFAGTTGETLVTMSGGLTVLRLRIEGNARFTATGGQVGLTPAAGVQSLIAQDDAIVTFAGASVEDNVEVLGSAKLVVTDGSVDHFLAVRDDATATINGGTIGRVMHTFDDSRFTIAGGTVGREFAAMDRSVVNMTGGGLEQDAGVFDDAVFNLRGGAIETGFRAYGGKMNIMGGVVGDFFRLGSPSRPEEGNVEIFATSASIDGLEITGSRVITEREGQFLTADLPLGGLIGLDLQPFGTDRISEEGLLMLTIVNETGDANGDGTVDAIDYTVWRDNFGNEVAWFTNGDFDGSGVVDNADYALWQAAYAGSLGGGGITAIPEPLSLMLAMTAAALTATRRTRVLR
ncbi:MAG: hypothetical protein AAF266_08030 [Planctomycetota bacterium]